MYGVNWISFHILGLGINGEIWKGKARLCFDFGTFLVLFVRRGDATIKESLSPSHQAAAVSAAQQLSRKLSLWPIMLYFICFSFYADPHLHQNTTKAAYSQFHFFFTVVPVATKNSKHLEGLESMYFYLQGRRQLMG